MPALLIFLRSDTAPLFSGGVAPFLRLPGPLLHFLFRCLGTYQKRHLRRGVSPCWLLPDGQRRLWRAGGSSLPVSAAAAATVQPPTAEPTTTAAADPTDPSLPAAAAPAVSATTGDWCRAGGSLVCRRSLRDTICGLDLVQVIVTLQ